MTHWIVIGVVAVFLVLRLGTRFRRRGKKEKRPRLGLGPFNGDVGLVAAREIRERFRGRLFRVGTLLVLAAVTRRSSSLSSTTASRSPNRSVSSAISPPRCEQPW